MQTRSSSDLARTRGRDFSPTSGPSGSYGGNLDYNEIAEGAVKSRLHHALRALQHTLREMGVAP